MDSQSELAIVRRAYAKQTLAAASIVDARLQEAFATIPREDLGATVPLDTADVIYVNAGVTYVVDAWLEGLADGGRLIVPLTTDANTRPLNFRGCPHRC